MGGFWHYFFSAVDPTMNLGFSRAVATLMTSALPSWWLLFVAPLSLIVLPSVLVWIVYQFRPSLIRPPLPQSPGQAMPMISVVIAGRNESATIGECIRGALTCGYPNVEVVFVDDHSNDNSVAVARRAALAVTGSSRDADRVRIFPSPRRNGKASSLNIGISMARGEFIVVHDADSVIPYGSMHHWLLPFADPRVGGVSANIRVNNSAVNFLTRLQEVEYALKYTVDRFVQSRLNLVNIITGMGGMFRAEILRRLGGFDTGLGDDTDLTTLLRKQRWKLGFSVDAVVWTTVPETRHHLFKQRERWRRNLIKIRVSKHRDMYFLSRYGLANAIIAIELLFKIFLPATGLIGLVWAVVEDGPWAAPEIIATFYWITILYLLVRVLITRDIGNAPKVANFPLILVYPLYMIWLQVVLLYAEWAELTRVGAKHPYVPDHVWEEIPWW